MRLQLFNSGERPPLAAITILTVTRDQRPGDAAQRRLTMEATKLATRLVPAPKHSFRHALLATALGAALVLPSFAPSAWAQVQGQNLTQQTQQQPPQALPSLSPIIQKVMPAVVNISVTMKGDAAMDDEDVGPDNQADNGGPNFPASPFDE